MQSIHHRSFNRRQFLKRLGFTGIASMGANALLMPGCSADSATKPNVLFIGADDLNDWIGEFGGHPDAITPNLDRLMQRGIKFTNAQCAAPICNPSRSAIFTGLRPSTTGVYDNGAPFRLSPKGEGAVTIPEYFHQHGYYTCGSGKMYHGAFPDPFGWDDYNPGLLKHSPSQKNPENKPLCGIPGLDNVDWGPVDFEDKEMRDHKTVSYCIKQLNKTHDNPFFMTCGIKLPHLAWYAPRKYFDLYDPETIAMPQVLENDLNDVPAAGQKMIHRDLFEKIKKSGKWNEGVRAYLACVTFVDKQIGRLLDALDKSPYAKNTIIMFWGDHGWHLGEKSHWKKNTLWAEAARSPFFISAPGLTARDVCERPVSLLDMYPTLLELCGLPPKDELEGVSLMPLLRDPQKRWDRPALCTRGRGNHALIDERWRYIRYHDGSEELYDHQQDPNEWNNLAQDPAYSDIKKNFQKWLPKSDAPSSTKIEKSDYPVRIKELAAKRGVTLE